MSDLVVHNARPRFVVQVGSIAASSMTGTVAMMRWEFHSAYDGQIAAKEHADRLAECHEHVRVIDRGTDE